MTYFDYRFRFPVAGIAQALGGFAALRAAGVMPADGLPANMLGDPLDVAGALVMPDAGGELSGVAFRGRRGSAAIVSKDWTIPARGDTGYFYIHIRSTIDPATLPVSPAAFGLETVSAEESAAVLGAYA